MNDNHQEVLEKLESLKISNSSHPQCIACKSLEIIINQTYFIESNSEIKHSSSENEESKEGAEDSFPQI
jgi:hypothetical protein